MGYGKGEASRDFGVWPQYTAECRSAVNALLKAGGGLSAYRSNPNFPVGPREGSWAWKLERLAEKEFSVQHAVAVNSGTMALMAAIKGMRLPAGGEIITTPYSFSATVAAIVHAGYVPVFADVDPRFCTLDPISVRMVVTTKTVAIMPVDLFGGFAHHTALNRHGLPIIQDACQAVGALTREKKAGLYGTVAAWSFNGAKNVPAGEAGMLVTNDEAVATRARLFISHGENFLDAECGMNGRLNELVACVAYFGMKDVRRNNKIRQRLAGYLWDRLHRREEIKIEDEVTEHAFYVYPLLLRGDIDRQQFVKRMKSFGVEVGQGYIQPPLHKYAALKQYQRIPLPVVEQLSERSLCLLSQVRPPATIADMRYLADCIEAALDGKAPKGFKKIGFLAESVL